MADEPQNVTTLDDVKSFVDANKDNNDVKSYIASLSPVTLDRVKEFVGKDKDGTAWLDSEKDKHSDKTLKTWQENNLDKYYQGRYKKEHPNADPKDTKISELEKQFADMKAESAQKDLLNKTHDYLDRNKVKCRWLDKFVGKDEKETKRNLDDFMSGYKDDVNAGVDARIKGSGYTPPQHNKPQNLAYTMDQVKKMSAKEINAHWDDVKKTLAANKSGRFGALWTSIFASQHRA